jgi:hypothetical protein
MCHQRGDARSQLCGPAMSTTSQRQVSKLGLFYRLVQTSNIRYQQWQGIGPSHRQYRRFCGLCKLSIIPQHHPVPCEKDWKVTIQQFTAENWIMQYAGIKIQQFPHDSISMINPKSIHSMLQAQGFQDCSPAPTPHIDGHDMSDMQADEDMINLKTYQSILGSCRFLEDTNHPEIAYITGIAGQH